VAVYQADLDRLRFILREQKDHFRFGDEVKGGWKKKQSMPDSWNVNYEYSPLHGRGVGGEANLSLTLRLALTSFGHVGIFPEQGENWNFIFDTISN